MQVQRAFLIEKESIRSDWKELTKHKFSNTQNTENQLNYEC